MRREPTKKPRRRLRPGAWTVRKEPVSIEQTSLVLRLRQGDGEKVYWDAQWRFRTSAGEPWRFKKRRLGLAWIEADGEGNWRKRKGRCPEGWLDERSANVAAVQAMEGHAQIVASAAQRAQQERDRLVTVRVVAHDWLDWLEKVRGSKPSTVRDYRTLLREPGSPHKRGTKSSAGRIMATFGDDPTLEVTEAKVSRFLKSLDEAGFTPRNVNKYRQVLQALFGYACRSDSLGLAVNPVDGTDKRREPPPAPLDFYEIEEVEALARVCERGDHRPTPGVQPGEQTARAVEDHQDAEIFRVLFYTGIRIGELLTLRWADVMLDVPSILVRRTLSAGEETEPKGGRPRFVPLPDHAVAAIARLGARTDFTGDDDYVVCGRWGGRLDYSALRRRYHRGCEVAGLRRVKLHGLRHASGSILARAADPVFVRDYLGHTRLSTTDRYVGAKHRPEDFATLNRAFSRPALQPGVDPDRPSPGEQADLDLPADETLGAAETMTRQIAADPIPVASARLSEAADGSSG
ncbi:MAG TPA: tyrosine-type recombinase/integrase [Solirubrobacteraceae bacterium]